MMQTTFSTTGIHFHRYPFQPATVFPDKFLPWDAVQEMVPGWPPEVRTRQGEVLFVSAEHEDALKAAVQAAGIPLVKRFDVWDMILTPFLDTEFDEATHEHILAMLEANGISREECQQLRARVAQPMLAYNALLWDWVHLGLYDLLLAHRPLLATADFRAFYWEAMAIARRALPLPA